MPTRRTILKLLLWSLAGAAVSGVFAAMLPMRETMIRVTWTGVATAVAAGLMLIATILMERPRTRSAALFGLGWVVVQFLLALVLIWLDNILSNRSSEATAVTMGMLLLCAVPTIVYLVIGQFKSARLASWIGLGFTLAGFFSFEAATWEQSSSWWRDDQLWGTGWSFHGIGIIVACCFIRHDAGRLRWTRWIGVVLSAFALAFILEQIWNRKSNFDDEWAYTLVSTAILFAHANAIRAVNLVGRQMWLRPIAVGFMILTVLMSNLLVHGDVDDESLIARMTLACAIVTGCATLGMVVMIAVNRRSSVAPSAADLSDMNITCPRCQCRQDTGVGRSQCKACGLWIEIRVEEPRCSKCDHVLYGLKGGRCPECGTVC